MDDIQNVDKRADQVMKECFSNPVVVRRILEHFPNAELIHKLSFVNKLWNYEARSVLSKRGGLVAKFNHNCDNAYGNFTAFAFARVLRQMNVALFSGIHMNLRCKYESPDEDECPTVALHSTLEAIFDKLTLKEIFLKMYHSLWKPLGCAGFMLMKKLVDHYSKVLEMFSLDHITEHNAYWLVLHCKFPRLKTLKLRDQYWMSPRMERLCEPFSNFIKAMLRKAPNLQELHSGGDMIALGEMLQGTSVKLVYNDEEMARFHEIPDSLIGALRLQKLELGYSGRDFNLNRFSLVTPILLQASTTTLHDVRIDAILAVPLMCYGVCLKNVKDLVMWIDYDQLELIEPRLLRIVKDFDFTQIFPTLEKVQVYRGSGSGNYSQVHMSKIIEEASAVLEAPQLHRALNIKRLNISSSLSNASAQFFAEMFPSVDQLEVGQYLSRYGEVAFGSIWKNWKDLETLEVRADIAGNLDSIFCGIFPEEVAELEQKDDEYLKTVNIVPVMPAITCLKNLRTFTFKFSRIQDPAFQFSKVTGLIAFMRCPALTVSLSTYNRGVYEALRYMEPYASFVHKGLRTTSPLDVIKSILTRRVQ